MPPHNDIPPVSLFIVDADARDSNNLSNAVLRAIIVCLIIFVLFLILLMLYQKNRFAILYAYFCTSGSNLVDQRGYSQPTSPSFDPQIHHPMREMLGATSLAYPPMAHLDSPDLRKHHTFYA